MVLSCRRLKRLTAASIFAIVLVAMFVTSHASYLRNQDSELIRDKRHAGSNGKQKNDYYGEEESYDDGGDGEDTDESDENYDDEENEVGNPESWVKILNVTLFCDIEDENSEPVMQTAGQNPVFFGFMPSCDDFAMQSQDSMFIPFNDANQDLQEPRPGGFVDAWDNFINQQGHLGNDLSSILDMIFRTQYLGALNKDSNNTFSENGDKISQLRSVLSFALFDSQFSSTTETTSTYTTPTTNGDEGAWGVPDYAPTTTPNYNSIILRKLGLDLGLSFLPI